MGVCFGRDPPEGTIKKEEVQKMDPQTRSLKISFTLISILKAEDYKKHIVDLITLLDTSGNGTIELSEIKKFFADLQQLNSSQAKQNLVQDPEKQKQMDQILQLAFNEMDLDKDGKITYEELKAQFEKIRKNNCDNPLLKAEIKLN